MSLVKEKYLRLSPKASYLCDEVVLALAWKKTNQYVRRHNWYADVLELDCTAINLQENLHRWSTELASGKYLPRPARLVPAPKNSSWAFHSNLPNGWAPVKDAGDLDSGSGPQVERLNLRPLAHLGIREQTAATAVMLCLADCIESAQGNPETDLPLALSRGVYSYGNRLHCRWSADGGEARFSWGSSDSYGRYYKDYQQFVRRPHAAAGLIDEKTLPKDCRTYVVKLDLAAFFDNVDRGKLLLILREEYEAYQSKRPDIAGCDDQFWNVAEQILDFRWSSKDAGHASLLKGGHLPHGLPQGLMASGFLANAYLLRFDRLVGEACQKQAHIEFGSCALVARDYCRYVDDLRLVITGSQSLSEQEVGALASTWAQKLLDEALGSRGAQRVKRLRINSDKTETEVVSNVAGATGIGVRMNQLQQSLSGPFDLSSLMQTETSLNGLLSIAELASRNLRNTGSGPLPDLASVATPQLDVRDDTLTRFAAYRLCRSLRQRRLLTDMTEQRDGRLAGDVLRQDFELTARRLVAAWAWNPSMVQVLRYALDLFPSPTLLEHILSALAHKLDDQSSRADQAAVAWYVVAEILRAGAIETGRRVTRDLGFEVGDIFAYRDHLAAYAENLLQSGETPWFVQQQAALLLATVGSPTDQLQDLPELVRYRHLHHYLARTEAKREAEFGDALSTALVGNQLDGDDSAFIDWLERFCENLPFNRKRDAVELVLLANRHLLEVAASTKRAQTLFGGAVSAETSYLSKLHELRLVGDLPNERMSLAEAMCHPRKVFQQENALIHLGLALTDLMVTKAADMKIRSPFEIEVTCTDWALLNDPSVQSPLTLSLRARPLGPASHLYRMPLWCKSSHSWMYVIGRLLRAAALGDYDFTTTETLSAAEVGWYKGIPSTALKRRLGMHHSSRALGGTASAITPWFSGLLGVLLRWPGVFAEAGHEAELIETIDELRQLLERRRAYQGLLYGRGSSSAIYRYPVHWPTRQGNILRVATVQGLMPTEQDFADHKIVGLSAPVYRERHRNHTASLLKLAADKICARTSVLGRPHKPEVDLVVFPEYSIHIDDQDLLRAFADHTGAMLHYGLLGATHPVSGSPTNAARWLIPTHSADRSRRSWIEVDQGKRHLTRDEEALGVAAWCPYRVVIDLCSARGNTGFRMAGAICYDATDISLAADLRDETHLFVVPAMNKDIKTFDSMVSALRYHMYQHVVVSNAGSFGGSTAQAPYAEEHKRVICHSHGENQIAVGIFDISMNHFGPNMHADADRTNSTTPRVAVGKTPPAGLNRRS